MERWEGKSSWGRKKTKKKTRWLIQQFATLLNVYPKLPKRQVNFPTKLHREAIFHFRVELIPSGNDDLSVAIAAGWKHFFLRRIGEGGEHARLRPLFTTYSAFTASVSASEIPHEHPSRTPHSSTLLLTRRLIGLMHIISIWIPHSLFAST